MASKHGHFRIAEILILAGADKTITNDEKKTPEQMCLAEKQKEFEILFNFERFH